MFSEFLTIRTEKPDVWTPSDQENFDRLFPSLPGHTDKFFLALMKYKIYNARIASHSNY